MKAVFYLFVLASFTLSFAKMNAQDIHFSQTGNSPLNLNPALTGIFEGDMRFTGNYRSQWNAVPVSYETVSGAFDMSFYSEEYEKRFFSAGFIFNHDIAGDADLRTANLALTGSFTHRIARGHFLSLGAMFNYTNRSFDMGNLRFDNQFDKEINQYNPNFNNGESFKNKASANFFDVSTGVNWHYRVPRKHQRTSFDLGIGIMHFNQPERAFLSEDDTEVLRLRWSPYFFSTLQFHDQFDFLVQGTVQRQGINQEIAYGVGLQYHHDVTPDQELAFQLGLTRRARDVWSPTAGMRYRMWKATFSYDINTSPFRTATGARGGPELSVMYIFSRVKPMEAKICPIYL